MKYRGMTITENRALLKGICALRRRGELVSIGPLSKLVPDADCDEIIVSSDDFMEIVAKAIEEAANG